jgi:ATP-binding cassette, subfamily B, bacterial
MLKQFVAFCHPHRLLLLDFGCAALLGMLEVGFPMAVRAFIDNLLPQQDLYCTRLFGQGVGVTRRA